MAEVGLVEVVDVEDEQTFGVHVGAEVLGVQVAVDPHPRRPVVGPPVVQVGHVGEEQAGRAAEERERVGRHLAELRPEAARVGPEEVVERLGEHVDDLLAPLGFWAAHPRSLGIRRREWRRDVAAPRSHRLASAVMNPVDDRGPTFDGVRIGRPATGALVDAGYRSLEDLPADLDRLIELHGVGPFAIARLKAART